MEEITNPETYPQMYKNIFYNQDNISNQWEKDRLLNNSSSSPLVKNKLEGCSLPYAMDYVVLRWIKDQIYN